MVRKSRIVGGSMRILRSYGKRAVRCRQVTVVSRSFSHTADEGIV
jgi:hypothetical protein